MRLSIVTISFNQCVYLQELISSLRPMLAPGDEHIVVDAGSTDGSRQLIDAYAAEDNRVKVIAEPDRGPADGLNKGFAAATGDVWTYINADDRFFRDTFAFVRRYFRENPGVDVLIGAIKIMGPGGYIRARGRVPSLPTLPRLACGVERYVQQGTFFRPEAFRQSGGFNISNRTCWDYELIVEMVLAKAKCRTVARPLGLFRLHGTSISANTHNGVAYTKDRQRVAQRLRSCGIVSPSPPLSWIVRAESRFNPLRRLAEWWPTPEM